MMPTYMLEGTSEVRLDAKPLILTLRVTGSPAQARMEATQNGLPLATAGRRPDTLILPGVEHPTLISIVPVGVERFPAPTTIHLNIAVQDRGATDPQHAVVMPIDVSGLDRKSLISLETIDGSISLKVARNHEDADLGPLANAARVTCREILGTQWVSETSALDMTLALDGSASSGPLVADGTAAALTAVLTGIAQVLSNGRTVSAAIIDDVLTPLPPMELGTIPRALTDTYTARIPTSSFRSAAGTTERVTPHISYVISTSLPADIADLEATNDSGTGTRHLVLASDPEAVHLLGGTSTWHTVVEPADTSQTLETRLLADPTALRAVVFSLLQGCFHEGSEFMAKVSQ